MSNRYFTISEMYKSEQNTTLSDPSVSATPGSWRLFCFSYGVAHSRSLFFVYSLVLTHSYTLTSTTTHHNVCPRCIYTYTLYGLFTNVVPTTTITIIIIVITIFINKPTSRLVYSTGRLVRNIENRLDRYIELQL